MGEADRGSRSAVIDERLMMERGVGVEFGVDFVRKISWLKGA